ncbi:MAG: hypothetical protein IJ520_10755 [Synergistaceae bacterium]|nr:hypothetical protein [Synergistaceae bacterium]MBR1602712.1 hypothetical protein [Synergistaceae bacterium]
MYEVISGGKRVALIETPRYIKVKPSTGAYIEADERHAQGIAINGKGVYSLKGKLKDLPECEVRKVDGGVVVFDHDSDLAGMHGDLLDIQTALCELDLA